MIKNEIHYSIKLAYLLQHPMYGPKVEIPYIEQYSKLMKNQPST